MMGFKNIFNVPFSDLWLPSLLIGMGIISVLGLHWLWLHWRVQSLLKKHNQTKAQTAQYSTPVTDIQRQQLSDIHAFTAQRQPVALEEQPHLETEYIPTTLIISDRLDSTFAESDNVDPHPETPSLGEASPLTVSGFDKAVFFKPHSTVLLPKPLLPAVPAVHAVLHYQARLIWSDAQGKQVLSEALIAKPWTHPQPVVWSQDAQNNCGAVAAWLVASRRELASGEDAEAFKQWCDEIAILSGARCELLTTAPWASFLDEAHTLLIGLDSVIVLKVAVPLVQLDLFAQSLLAARFIQSQEHWCYQEHEHSTPIYLERLWQQANADKANNQQAVFQVLIDIPHLDALEARKIYMRLRAVARASAAIIQSAQGVHLSEGMLDRYSRELMMKQEALIQAQVPPGSALAKLVYKPQLRLNQDLGLA